MAVMMTSAAQIAACLRCMSHLLIGECAAGGGIGSPYPCLRTYPPRRAMRVEPDATSPLSPTFRLSYQGAPRPEWTAVGVSIDRLGH